MVRSTRPFAALSYVTLALVALPAALGFGETLGVLRPDGQTQDPQKPGTQKPGAQKPGTQNQDPPKTEPGTQAADDADTGFDPERLQKAMQRAQRIRSPGPMHAELERFLGTWDVEVVYVLGGKEVPFGTGVMRYGWLIEGRWLQGAMRGKVNESNARMLGTDTTELYQILGYDNFKRSFVTVQVQSVDTAMLTSEGDLSREGDTLIIYGTLDEYLTGEHDKMVKYVWRFVGTDAMTLEIHDLPIGETGTQVLEYRYTRQD